MHAHQGHKTLWVATLLFLAAFYVFIVPLPLYLTKAGFPDWQVGVVLGALGIASLVARPFAGAVADGRGSRPVMLFGAGALGIGAVGMIFTTRAPLLLALRISQAIGYVAFSTAATPRRGSFSIWERRESGHDAHAGCCKRGVGRSHVLRRVSVVRSTGCSGGCCWRAPNAHDIIRHGV